MTPLKKPFRSSAISSSAFRLVGGRVIGGTASFAIPVVLARILDPSAFGTYKQLFLVYATMFGVAQLGAAESLYYFVPRRPEHAGRSVCNALVSLSIVGAGCAILLFLGRFTIAGWLSNPGLVGHLPLIGVFLAFMLVSAAFEIVMVSRNEPGKAALTYAASDIVRTTLFVSPGLLLRSLDAVLVGAIAFAASRVFAMLVYLWREFGRDFRIDATIWHSQLAYALPFALAVAVDVLQANAHQWVVATRFDAAAFAIYAVGCLQIPLVDLICTSTANVMMVKMAEAAAEGERARLALWHETTIRLATMMFPLAAVLCLSAHHVIVFLFTSTYLASVPIFRIWCLMVLPAAFAVDGVLRSYAQTRFLLVMNAIRLMVIVGLVGSLISTFGVVGAVLATLIGTMLVKSLAVIRIARLMKVGIPSVLPWKQLALVAVHAALPLFPAWLVIRMVHGPILVALVGAWATYSAIYAAIWYGARLHFRVHGVGFNQPEIVKAESQSA